MNSIDLTKLMQEAGVEKDVIDAACQKNNELLQTELQFSERILNGTRDLKSAEAA